MLGVLSVCLCSSVPLSLSLCLHHLSPWLSVCESVFSMCLCLCVSNFTSVFLPLSCVSVSGTVSFSLYQSFRSWRESSAIKSTHCSSRGLDFDSQQPYGRSQLSVLPVPGDLRTSLTSVGTKPTRYTDIHTQTDKTFMHIIYVFLRGREGRTCVAHKRRTKHPILPWFSPSV